MRLFFSLQTMPPGDFLIFSGLIIKPIKYKAFKVPTELRLFENAYEVNITIFFQPEMLTYFCSCMLKNHIGTVKFTIIYPFWLCSSNFYVYQTDCLSLKSDDG